jgi:hypothetical protein
MPDPRVEEERAKLRKRLAQLQDDQQRMAVKTTMVAKKIAKTVAQLQALPEPTP